MAALVIHETHLPETDEERLFDNVLYCKRCCRLLEGSHRGVTDTGAAECRGPVRITTRKEVVTWPARKAAEPTPAVK